MPVGDSEPRRSAQATSEDKGETIAWLVSPGLALIAVTYGLARFAYGLYLPEMREAFDLSPSLLGLIGAGSYVGYCVAVVVALVYTSRTGPRLMAGAAGVDRKSVVEGKRVDLGGRRIIKKNRTSP